MDSMGVLRTPGDDGSEEVGFFELVGFDFRPLTVTMVYCNQVKSRATITDKLEKARLELGFWCLNHCFQRGMS
jgi:hypothetical protein